MTEFLVKVGLIAFVIIPFFRTAGEYSLHNSDAGLLVGAIWFLIVVPFVYIVWRLKWR